MIIWEGVINVFLPNSQLYWFCFVCFQMMENQIKLRFILQFPSLNFNYQWRNLKWNDWWLGPLTYQPKQCTYTVHTYTWQSWIGWAKTNESKREVWTEKKKHWEGLVTMARDLTMIICVLLRQTKRPSFPTPRKVLFLKFFPGIIKGGNLPFCVF